MARVFLIVMDSVGCGGAPDAADFGDEGSNTLLHIAQSRPDGLSMPNLNTIGLGRAITLASGETAPGLEPVVLSGQWGAATEESPGKDTPSGHWELAGVPVPFQWHTYPDAEPAFPQDAVAEVCRIAGVAGILGNCHASGTEIIARLGEDHIRTGWPICYTSADSVFQIAAHEEHFGLDRLLDLCAELAPGLHAQRVGRVIARPFTGDAESGFVRTQNRKDFARLPPAPTLCDRAQAAGVRVEAIGKIGDIFSMRGIDALSKGTDADLMEHLSCAVDESPENTLVFANFVEFDSLYGHRRDPEGYARALEWFDKEIGTILPRLRPEDLMIFTADHGNDPTWSGTDHTRERVPVLIAGQGAGEIGLIPFTGVGAIAARHLDIPEGT